MLKTYKNLDRETRRMVTEAFVLFFKLGTKNFVLDTQEEGSREIRKMIEKISEHIGGAQKRFPLRQERVFPAQSPHQKLVERKK